MSNPDQSTSWEDMEAMGDIPFQEKASHEAMLEIVILARELCFSRDEFKVSGEAGRKHDRAAKFILGASYVTFAALDSRRYPDIDIMVDERDQPGQPLIVRDKFEFTNSRFFRANNPKIAASPSREFYVGGKKIDVDKALPKQPKGEGDRYGIIFERPKRAYHRALRRTSITVPHFSIADQHRLKTVVEEISKGIRPYDVGSNALTTDHLV